MYRLESTPWAHRRLLCKSAVCHSITPVVLFGSQVPPCLLCGTFLDYVHETNFWMSSGGTRSVIHYDADHNLHCLVAGRKDFMMIEKQYYKDLYFLEKVSSVCKRNIFVCQ